MTMADTIAVMNAGKVEQLGPPAELYDAPATVFVANFLGQSNLVRGQVTGRSGEDVLLDVNGRKVVVPAQRNRASGTEVFVGVRPEKIRMSSTQDSRSGENALDGVVTDASFIGVSTQYLVRTPWDQELMVFAQNAGGDAPVAPGTQVVLRWDPAHTFCLDADEDITAGLILDDEAVDMAVTAPS
jgi:spermidine/putrescine transport system ATP-binding protein